jgi:hypothetical protein
MSDWISVTERLPLPNIVVHVLRGTLVTAGPVREVGSGFVWDLIQDSIEPVKH